MIWAILLCWPRDMREMITKPDRLAHDVEADINGTAICRPIFYVVIMLIFFSSFGRHGVDWASSSITLLREEKEREWKRRMKEREKKSSVCGHTRPLASGCFSKSYPASHRPAFTLCIYRDTRVSCSMPSGDIIHRYVRLYRARGNYTILSFYQDAWVGGLTPQWYSDHIS